MLSPKILSFDCRYHRHKVKLVYYDGTKKTLTMYGAYISDYYYEFEKSWMENEGLINWKIHHRYRTFKLTNKSPVVYVERYGTIHG